MKREFGRQNAAKEDSRVIYAFQRPWRYATWTDEKACKPRLTIELIYGRIRLLVMNIAINKRFNYDYYTRQIGRDDGDFQDM